jgi:Flp pilus assembly protein TadG
VTQQINLLRLVRALVRNRSGSAAIEAAFVLPAMLMFIFGIGEVGRVLWLQNALNYSVVEAARCLSNSPGTCANASQTQSFAAGESGAGFDASVFTVAAAGCGNQVSASFPVVFDIPFLTLSTTLTSSACYPT